MKKKNPSRVLRKNIFDECSVRGKRYLNVREMKATKTNKRFVYGRKFTFSHFCADNKTISISGFCFQAPDAMNLCKGL